MIDKNYFGEGKNIEFKREIPGNHEKFLKDIIAFSNSTGGKVIVGIEDETGTVYELANKAHLNCRIPFLIWFQLRVHHRLNRIFQSRQ